MALIILNIIFLVLTLCNTQQTDPNYCTPDFLFKDVPGGIANEVFSIITTGTIQNVVGCEPVEVEENLIKFLLYNRENLNTPISINSTNLNGLDPAKPTIFQLHGWLCSSSKSKMPDLKNAYLSRYDANVIIVDWSQYSIDLYSKSFCYIPPIAEIIGKMICNMVGTLNVDVNTIHVVGHSMGGQMSGLTGKEVQKQCGKNIGRITALDPAGPLYQYISTDKRLDKSDANSVDVIHSNMGFMGYFDDCGTADFYPNCGVQQPGCLSFSNVINIEEIFNFPFALIVCDHLRSLDYMIESIENSTPKFIGKRCDLIPALPIIGLCGSLVITRDKAEMGENCPANPPGRKFCLTTNSESPFAIEQGFPTFFLLRLPGL